MKNKDSKAAPNGSKDDKKDDKDASNEAAKGRKPNFFERKRFVNYEPNASNSDEDDPK